MSGQGPPEGGHYDKADTTKGDVRLMADTAK